MKRSVPSLASTDLAERLAAAQAGLALEAPGALDAMATLASDALAAGRPTLAACAASSVVLVEHVTAALYRHAADMLGILAHVGPAAAEGHEGLVAWAGAAVAHDYGVLPSWSPPNPNLLLERAQRAPDDVALMLACALGEVCERNGDDAGFAAMQSDGGRTGTRQCVAVLAWPLGGRLRLAPRVIRQEPGGDGPARRGAGARARARPA